MNSYYDDRRISVGDACFAVAVILLLAVFAAVVSFEPIEDGQNVRQSQPPIQMDFAVGTTNSSSELSSEQRKKIGDFIHTVKVRFPGPKNLRIIGNMSPLNEKATTFYSDGTIGEEWCSALVVKGDEQLLMQSVKDALISLGFPQERIFFNEMLGEKSYGGIVTLETF